MCLVVSVCVHWDVLRSTNSNNFTVHLRQVMQWTALCVTFALLTTGISAASVADHVDVELKAKTPAEDRTLLVFLYLPQFLSFATSIVKYLVG